MDRGLSEKQKEGEEYLGLGPLLMENLRPEEPMMYLSRITMIFPH